MTEDRGPLDRKGSGGPTRKKVRPRPSPAPRVGAPVPAGSRPAGSQAGRARQVRPWEVDPIADAEEERRAHDPEILLADAPADAVISVRRLTKEYDGLDRPAVDMLDLDIRAGEVFGLL